MNKKVKITMSKDLWERLNDNVSVCDLYDIGGCSVCPLNNGRNCGQPLEFVVDEIEEVKK